MSKRRRSRLRLRTLRRNAWLDLPRELSRYGGTLAIAGGAILCARGSHVVETGRTDVVTVDSRGLGPHRGGSTVQVTGTSAQVSGGFDIAWGTVLAGFGIAALFVKRNKRFP